MVWVRSPVYFYKRNDTFYFSRAVPSDLRSRFHKRKIEVSLRTKSEAKAAKSAAALSDRLERYWDSLRMEMIYSRELGLKALQNATPHANDLELVGGKSDPKSSLIHQQTKPRHSILIGGGRRQTSNRRLLFAYVGSFTPCPQIASINWPCPNTTSHWEIIDEFV